MNESKPAPFPEENVQLREMLPEHRNLVLSRYILDESGKVCMSSKHPAVMNEWSVGRSKTLVYLEGHPVASEVVRYCTEGVAYVVQVSDIKRYLDPEF